MGMVLIGLILLIIIFLVGFYFWGSSPTESEENYSRIYCSAIEPQPQDDTNNTISILTYNIGYLSGMLNNKPTRLPKSTIQKNLERAVDLLGDIHADVVALQEIDFQAARTSCVNQNRWIADRLYPYTAEMVVWDKHYVPFPYGFFHIHYGRVLSGQSILSHFPIQNIQRIVLPQVETAPFYYRAFYLTRAIQVAHIEHPKKPFTLINVHLEAFDFDIRQKHLQVTYHLLKQLSATQPVILLGDLNSDIREKEAAFNVFFENEEIGCAGISRDNQQIINTFPADAPKERLDYIFYTRRDFELISSSVLTEFGQVSDHFPCHAVFSIKSDQRK